MPGLSADACIKIQNWRRRSWIHMEYQNRNRLAETYRSFREVEERYNCFHKIVCRSDCAKKLFFIKSECTWLCFYNVNDYPGIIQASKVKIEDDLFSDKIFNMIAVGKIQPSKGFERLVKIALQLKKKGILSACIFWEWEYKKES